VRVTYSIQPYAITVRFREHRQVLLNLPVDVLTVFVWNVQNEVFAFRIWACMYQRV